MEAIKKLFFEQSLKHWHFEEIVRVTGISRERVNHFLKELLKRGIILRIKPKNKMPYYAANRESIKFRFEKRLCGLSILQESGLIEHIGQIDGVKTAIIFGSFSKGDWNPSSDVDLFIYGKPKGFLKGEFETRLKHEIQVFAFSHPQKIKKELDPNLIPNIAQGFYVKGDSGLFRIDLK